jgi:23S rRNA (guanosine2251-2'-O)-methyltransferase
MPWIYGRHAVFAALDNPRRKLKRLLVTPHFKEIDALKGTVRIETTSPEFLAQKFGETAVHQGIALETGDLIPQHLEDILEQTSEKTVSLLVFLDQVTDPHNVGAITRSAAAFKIDALILPQQNSLSPDNETVAKTACGGVEYVPLVMVSNLARAMAQVKEAGYWCIGLDEEGPQPIQHINLTGKVAFVLGAEGKGLRRLTKENCDLLTQLPTAPAFPTLNVSNAAAIAFYEYCRQNTK